MRARYSFALLIAALAFGAAIAVGAPVRRITATTNCDTTAAGYDSEEQAFLQLINSYRQQNGLGALTPSPTLNQSAAWKSQDMASNDYFAHDDIPIGRTWTQRLQDCGYTYNTYLGENIAAGTSGAADALNAWKNSPGHNANMLGTNYNAIGIGRAYAASSPAGWYWTTDFGGVVDAAAPSPTQTATATRSPTATPAPSTPTPASPPASYPCADFTGDGVVRLDDITYVLTRFGQYGTPADIDHDGKVTVIDILIVLRQYDTSCS